MIRSRLGLTSLTAVCCGLLAACGGSLPAQREPGDMLTDLWSDLGPLLVDDPEGPDMVELVQHHIRVGRYRENGAFSSASTDIQGRSFVLLFVSQDELNERGFPNCHDGATGFCYRDDAEMSELHARGVVIVDYPDEYTDVWYSAMIAHELRHVLDSFRSWQIGCGTDQDCMRIRTEVHAYELMGRVLDRATNGRFFAGVDRYLRTHPETEDDGAADNGLTEEMVDIFPEALSWKEDLYRASVYNFIAGLRRMQNRGGDITERSRWILAVEEAGDRQDRLAISLFVAIGFLLLSIIGNELVQRRRLKDHRRK